MNPETHHWLRCLHFEQDSQPKQHNENGTGRKAADEPELPPPSSMSATVRNGVDVLQLLGPVITAQALQRTDLPSADDSTGAWRLFGASCRCEVPYKESLLYCHCQATVEPLDSQFVFRDALLSKLLAMEKAASMTVKNPFRFNYNMIADNEEIQSLAVQTVSNIVKQSVVDSRRLLSKTFAALRKDGLLYLVDAETDIYILISREQVLEPYVSKLIDKNPESTLERKALQSEKPRYLKNVPLSRIQYVRRCLVMSENKQY
jgi:hypothetical protein